MVHNDCTSDTLEFKSKTLLEEHFQKHGDEFGGLYHNTEEYLVGANYVVKNGTYVPEMNRYIRYYNTGKKVQFAFVGLTHDGRYITTYGLRSVYKLAEKVPWIIP